MDEKFKKLVSGVFLLKISTRFVSRFPSKNRAGRWLLGVLCLGLLGNFNLNAAQNHIILLDTSGSMNYVLKEDKLPNVAKPAGQPSRIDAIKDPFKDYIRKDIALGDTLYLYQFNGAMYPGKKRKGGGDFLPKVIKINGEPDRGKATQWVDELKGEAYSLTHLYSSLDKVLIKAGELLNKHGQAPSLLIISDGKDTEQGGRFKNMGAVLKNHHATIKNLDGKVFCKIVKFELSDANEGALKDNDFIISQPEDLKDVFAPFINITAEFTVDPPVPFTGQKIAFTNETKTNPKNPRQAHLTPDKLKYKWDFGDGVASAKITPTHSYEKAGDYNATLKATNPMNPNDIDTFSFRLTVKDVVIVPGFAIKFNQKLLPGDNPVWTAKENGALVEIENNSTAKNDKPIPPAQLTYKWDFGNLVKPADRFSDKEVPAPRQFPVGKHEIKLTASYADPKNPALKVSKFISQFLTVSKLVAGELFISNPNPWIGEAINLQSLVPIPAAVKVKTTFTWSLGKGLAPVMGEKIGGYAYLEPGKKMVKLVIKRPDRNVAIEVKAMVNVLGVKPKIDVAPDNLDVYIGQPIPFKVVNNAPDTGKAFPPKTEIKWDFGDQKEGAKGEQMVRFEKPGPKKATVRISVPGVKMPFETSIEFSVKAVEVIIGVQKSEPK